MSTQQRRKQITIIVVVVFVMGVCNVPSLYALGWESGYHEFSEGRESEVDMFNGATADITGGEIGILCCWDTSSVFVYEPSEIDLLRPNDSSTASIYGGAINVIFTLGSSDTNIYSGSINEIDAIDLSTVNLYTTSYELDPTGGSFGDGLVTGSWLSTGDSFSIELRGEWTIDHIHFVPEPSMITFFIIGALMFSHTIKKK